MVIVYISLDTELSESVGLYLGGHLEVAGCLVVQLQ